MESELVGQTSTHGSEETPLVESEQTTDNLRPQINEFFLSTFDVFHYVDRFTNNHQFFSRLLHYRRTYSEAKDTSNGDDVGYGYNYVLAHDSILIHKSAAHTVS